MSAIWLVALGVRTSLVWIVAFLQEAGSGTDVQCRGGLLGVVGGIGFGDAPGVGAWVLGESDDDLLSHG